MRACVRPVGEESSRIGCRHRTYIVFCDHLGHCTLGHPQRSAPDCWPPEMITLEVLDTFRAQPRRVLGVLNAFGHRGQTEPLDETEEMAEKNPGLRPARQISNQRFP